MAVNTANQFQADVQQYIADETLPLARRQLVAYQAGEPLTLPKGMGTTYTATRFRRIPLPQYPLAEGVPPPGQSMTIEQVTGVAQQWGDAVKITDQAEIQTKHPLFKMAMELVGLQIAEVFERNTFNMLMALTQVNYVNSRGSRGALVAGDVLDTTTVLRTVAALQTLGAPRFMGDEQTDTKLVAESGGARADDSPRGMPHYIGICHTIPVADWSQNSTVVLARTYSAVNRLYNYEIGEWGGSRWIVSNLVPTFAGFANNAAGLAVAAQAGGGNLLATNYFVIVTGSDTQNQYESQIYAVSASTAASAGGSLVVTTPSTAGFTYNIYLGTTNTPSNLATTTSAFSPATGPAAGQAVQLPPATNVVITGLGIFQTPPAKPNNAVTVYPSFLIGRGLFGQIVLDNVKYAYLKDADKFDYMNQQRIVSWKAYYGSIILNQQFGARIEHTSAFSPTFG